MRPTVIDLFCGIGGFSYGFEKAGFDIILGIDNWDIAIETFGNNHKNVKTVSDNLADIDNSFFKAYKNKVDVIIAGPPCQGFSMSGRRDINDKRNTLFEEVIRVVSVIKPKVVVMENVPGLLSMKTPGGYPVKELIIKRFNKIEYNTRYQILNSADFGVPQLRKRVIFISTRKEEIGFPSITHFKTPYTTSGGQKIKKYVTVSNALANIPNVNRQRYLTPKSAFQKLMSNGTKSIYNHEAMNHSGHIIKRMSFVPPGGNWSDVPAKYYNVGGNHSNNYRRLHPERPAITLKHATKSMIIHPEYNRCLTVREVARLQSFPDDFIFYGTKFQQHQQLANAVPPLLGFTIAAHIKANLRKKNTLRKRPLKKTSNEKFTFIDLFCGIGGFRWALEKNDCRCVFSCDIDQRARESYFLNFNEWPEGDIKKIPSDKIPAHDIFCAGFPCQPFSIGGERKGFADARGTLFFDVARVLKDKQPKAFILENVKGLINHDKGNTINIIRTILTETGYIHFEKILNAKDFGLPQNRLRWFCVGFRKDLKITDFEFPKPIPLKRTVSQLLNKNAKGYGISEIALKHVKKFYKKFAQRSDNHEFTLANEIRPSRCVMRNDGISPCLTAKMGTGGNNVPFIVELERKLTVTECLKLMGFPASFKIKENVHQSYKQIGNSVPVPIVQKIAKEVIKNINASQV